MDYLKKLSVQMFTAKLVEKILDNHTINDAFHLSEEYLWEKVTKITNG